MFTTYKMVVQTHILFPSIFLHKAKFSFSKSNRLFQKSKNRRVIRSSSLEDDSNGDVGRKKRKVVEHICLLKAKDDIDDEKENVMLDYLYTTQYQMSGIVAVSLGRISDQNPENYTHALYMRFQRREDLEKLYEDTFYLGVFKDHVMPYCHGLINVDYETEVQDDILAIFRKGEEFNFGVEFITLIEFIESAMGKPVEDALASLINLTQKFPSLIVQGTQGPNFNPTSKEYTHGMTIRFRSLEAFEIFMSCSEYEDMWKSKFQTITRQMLSVHFSVDPVGTELMLIGFTVMLVDAPTFSEISRCEIENNGVAHSTKKEPHSRK